MHTSPLSSLGTLATTLRSLQKEHISVLPGFFVTQEAFSTLARDNNLHAFIEEKLSSFDPKNTQDVKEKSGQIQRHVKSLEFSKELSHQLLHMYMSLKATKVCLRLSVPDTIAGQSFISSKRAWFGIKGESNFFECIKDILAAQFEPEALYYRHKANVDHCSLPLTLCVQKEPSVVATGTLLTQDPGSAKGISLIKAVFGFGGLHQELDGSDYYWIDRSTGNVDHSLTSPQKKKILWSHGESTKEATAQSSVEKRKLTDTVLKEIAQLSHRLQHVLFYPQECTWLYDGQRVYIMSSTPSTALALPTLVRDTATLYGRAVKEGITSGNVKHFIPTQDYAHYGKEHIIVTPSLSIVPKEVINRVSGIIAEHDDIHCPQVLYVAQAGIPTLVGVPQAAHYLKVGSRVTIHTPSAQVRIEVHTKDTPTAAPTPLAESTPSFFPEVTPLIQVKIATKPNFLSTHPKSIALDATPILSTLTSPSTGYHTPTTSLLLTSLQRVMSSIPTPTVFYQFSLRGLSTQSEQAPALGEFYGAMRMLYAPSFYSTELEALHKLAHAYAGTIIPIIPFVRAVHEVKKVKSLFEKHGLERSAKIRLAASIASPQLLWQISHLVDQGLDYVVFDLDALEHHLTGIQDPGQVLEYASAESALIFKKLIGQAVLACHEQGVYCAFSTTGQLSDDMLQLAVEEKVEHILVPTRSLHSVLS